MTLRLCSVCWLLAGSWGTPPRGAASQDAVAAVPAVKAGTAYQRFMVIGDMGTGGKGQAQVAASMARRASRTPIDFVLTVGDNFYPEGVSSVDDPQWQEKFERMYRDPSLQVPFYATLGNHDRLGNVQAQVAYTERSVRWRMPDRHYRFRQRLDDGTIVEFWALDSQSIARGRHDLAEQTGWLDRTMARSDARWRIVFGHHPLYGHTEDRGRNELMIEHVGPILERHGADLYLSGHEHAMEMIKPVRGVYHAISGGGSGPENAYSVKWTDESEFVATGGGFLICRISRDQLVIEFVDIDGDTDYVQVIDKAPAENRPAVPAPAAAEIHGN